MFWLGLVALFLFLYFGCDMSLGAIMLWICVYCIIAGSADFIRWKKRR